MNTQTEKLRQIAQKLLADGTVQTVIGYVDEGEIGVAIPIFISDASDAERLVWNDHCIPNLSSYLLNCKGKTAITAKPCDVRAIVNLIVEKQISRDDVYVIGLDCPGMKSDDEKLLPACLECKINIPPIFDEHIENPDAKTKKTEASQASADLNGSLERFVSEMEKCILCFSCRQACYGCYCQTCFMDRGVPDWQPTDPDINAKMMYHLGRAMHLAGRCVECGSCENTCASGVNIRYIISEITDFVEELYDFKTGLSLDETPAMLRYETDDEEVGFVGGDGHE